MSDIWTFQERRNYEAEQLLSALSLQPPSEARDQAIASLYSELYWSTVPRRDRETGKIDWDDWRNRRRGIGIEAERRGLDLHYVIGTGPGTYHMIRFIDPEMRAAIRDFEQTISNR